MVDIAQAKRLNEEVKQARNTLNQMKAEINVKIKMVNDSCKQLSEEYGYEITPENIEQVYADETKKLEEEVSKAQEIISRIKKDM